MARGKYCINHGAVWHTHNAGMETFIKLVAYDGVMNPGNPYHGEPREPPPESPRVRVGVGARNVTAASPWVGPCGCGWCKQDRRRRLWDRMRREVDVSISRGKWRGNLFI